MQADSAVLKVAGFSTTDGQGGAARAALRIHRALCASGVQATLYVSRRSNGDPTVEGPHGAFAKAAALIRPRLGSALLRLARPGTEGKHSIAVLPSSRVRRLNRSDADICHLHWVADEMLSVGDVGRIRKPVVWTLHDMWAFSGAEHLAWDDRYREGYHRGNRPPTAGGLDLNRWVWRRKRRSWRRPMQIVTPSHWLAECVRQSALMREWPVEVIPNPIDTDVWRPVDMAAAREALSIRPGARLLVFGSMGENRAHHKGGDLLAAAVARLAPTTPDLELLIFGEDRPAGPGAWGVPTHYAGVLSDELSMRLVYSAADALVIPSRLDNLPNTGVEALACGTPVVAFGTCGLPDLVVHQENGYLARPFETEDLAHGISWVLEAPERSARLRAGARAFAQRYLSAPRIGGRYRALYEGMLDGPVPEAGP